MELPSRLSRPMCTFSRVLEPPLCSATTEPGCVRKNTTSSWFPATCATSGCMCDSSSPQVNFATLHSLGSHCLPVSARATTPSANTSGPCRTKRVERSHQQTARNIGMLSGLGQRTEGELLPVAVRDQGGVGLVPPTPPPLEQLLRILAQLGLVLLQDFRQGDVGVVPPGEGAEAGEECVRCLLPVHPPGTATLGGSPPTRSGFLPR